MSRLVLAVTSEGRMRVQIAGRTSSGVPNDWYVVDQDGLPHPEATRFLSHLRHLESSPHTIRAYAYDLADYLTFLEEQDLALDDVSNEVLGLFAHWLRAPSGNVVALADGEAARKRTTVNRALSAVASFYRFLGSDGRGCVGYKGYKRLADSAWGYRRAEVSVIDNVGKARRYREFSRLGPRLPAKVEPLSVLTMQQVYTLLEACRTYGERLFFALAFTTGMRIGQILGLRHEDIDTRTRTISIVPRAENENVVRAKSKVVHQIPITRDLARLYTTYMHEEYGYIDSDYVFIKLHGRNVGEALKPRAIYHIVDRLKRDTGITRWTPHTFRHTYVTLQQQAGVPIDVISSLVTHANIHTTVSTYGHLSVEDLRAALIRHGAWEEGA